MKKPNLRHLSVFAVTQAVTGDGTAHRKIAARIAQVHAPTSSAAREAVTDSADFRAHASQRHRGGHMRSLQSFFTASLAIGILSSCGGGDGTSTPNTSN